MFIVYVSPYAFFYTYSENPGQPLDNVVKQIV